MASDREDAAGHGFNPDIDVMELFRTRQCVRIAAPMVLHRVRVSGLWPRRSGVSCDTRAGPCTAGSKVRASYRTRAWA